MVGGYRPRPCAVAWIALPIGCLGRPAKRRSTLAHPQRRVRMASLALSRCSSRAIGSRQAAAPRRLSAGSNARRVAVRVAQVEAKNSVKPGE